MKMFSDFQLTAIRCIHLKADRNYARKMKKAAKRQRQKDRERATKAVEKYMGGVTMAAALKHNAGVIYALVYVSWSHFGTGELVFIHNF